MNRNGKLESCESALSKEKVGAVEAEDHDQLQDQQNHHSHHQHQHQNNAVKQPDNDSHPSLLNRMGKQDRKRLKKLRKRAANVTVEAEYSGLLTQAEWSELDSLLMLSSTTASLENAQTDKTKATHPIFGPMISRRKRKEARKVEISHHRDLIAWCMDRIRKPSSSLQPQSKKRARPDDTMNGENFFFNKTHNTPVVPSWASIHNPVTVQNLIVIEAQMPVDMHLEECQSIVDTALSESCNKKTSLHLPTVLFQGNHPKSISDGLLYYSSTPPTTNFNQKKNQSVKTTEESQSNDSLIWIYRQLQEMTLPIDHWEMEGYPIRDESIALIEPTNIDVREYDIDVPLSIENLSMINPSQAKEMIIARGGFRIRNQSADDTQLYLQTLQKNEMAETRVFGMDCEMVKTEVGAELARITILEVVAFENGKLETRTVLDTLVKPDSPVLDYLTRFSGITAEMLNPVTTTLGQVQVALQSFLRPSDILVGHSLENDLMAAHFIHPLVVDTSLIFRHRQKRTKFALRHISASLLKKVIQRGSHCSKEDAEAALELAIQRALLGDEFSLPDTEVRRSIFERWENHSSDLKMVAIGSAAWLQGHITNNANGIHALSYESIVECQKALLAWSKGNRKARFALCRLVVGAHKENGIDAFQKLLVEIVKHTSHNTVIVVCFQKGSDKTQKKFKARRVGLDQRSTLGWDSEKEAKWKEALELNRNGMVSWISSHTSDDLE